MITTVAKQKLFTVLDSNNYMETVYEGVSAEANNPDWIEFYTAEYVSIDDPLYYAIQMALNLTSAQMLSLFQTAQQIGS